MYKIIDLRFNPTVFVNNMVFETIEECCLWIDENGDASIYSYIKID